MTKPYLLSLSLCFLVSFHGCLAQIEQQQWPGQQQQQQRRVRGQSQCRIESLGALEPTSRIESEAGVTEYWDENNEQFECAGVAAVRYVIQPRGLLLPSFSNAPRLIYIIQGEGIAGALIPGCPETFQSFQQSQQSRRQGHRYRDDQHQKIQYFRQGDIVALPAGVAHWCYNDGETPLVAIAVLDTSNNANQLDQNLRRFQLAGSQKKQITWSYRPQPTSQQPARNIFNGFDVQTLAEVFGVSRETARKLQNLEDKRGEIVRVENGLRVVRLPREEEQEQQEYGTNGLEESLCTMRLKQNIEDPDRADVYSPNGGRISTLNSQKLPILRFLQMSAERGVLYRNSIIAPKWNLNAHSVIYVTRGSGRVQIVGNYGRPVFNGELRQDQLLIVPQNFAVVKQAGNQGFEWVSFKTNDNAMASPLAGRTSVFRGMPEEVLTNAYQISREEARRLKYNREEVVILGPRSRSRYGLM